MTWTDATTESGVGGFDLDGDNLADFVIGTNNYAPILYRGGAGGPIKVVVGGLSNLTSSLSIAVSDYDGDGRPDFTGVSAGDSSASPVIQWAGSDGTTNPRAYKLILPADVNFDGRLVR